MADRSTLQRDSRPFRVGAALRLLYPSGTAADRSFPYLARIAYHPVARDVIERTKSTERYPFLRRGRLFGNG